MRRTCWTSMLTLVLFASSARATTLGPWTLGPATNGNYEHDGIAGVPGYLYTVTGTSAEVAPIFVDGSVGSWTVTSSLNFARAYGRTLATASNVYVAGGWLPGQPGSTGAGHDGTAAVEAARDAQALGRGGPGGEGTPAASRSSTPSTSRGTSAPRDLGELPAGIALRNLVRVESS